MLRRLAALIVILALLGGGLYYWKSRETGAAPVRLLEVGKRLADARITGEVVGALHLNRNLAPWAIDVGTEEGVVTLRGDVPREELRATAERVAAAVPDVRQVVNHLRVNPAAAPPSTPERTLGESLDDHALELRVRLALSLNRELKGTEIGVRSFRREITLEGEVATPRQRQLAVEVARETMGVGSIRDELRVRPASATDGGAGAGPGAPTDRRSAVRQALAANSSLKPYVIDVREEGGALVLVGRVRTGAERDLAGLLARDAAGGPVKNALEIGP